MAVSGSSLSESFLIRFPERVVPFFHWNMPGEECFGIAQLCFGQIHFGQQPPQFFLQRCNPAWIHFPAPHLFHPQQGIVCVALLDISFTAVNQILFHFGVTLEQICFKFIRAIAPFQLVTIKMPALFEQAVRAYKLIRLYPLLNPGKIGKVFLCIPYQACLLLRWE